MGNPRLRRLRWRRGEQAALFVFDEELGLLFTRTKAMGIDLEAMVKGGKLTIEQVDAAEISPGEFAHRVRNCVTAQKVHERQQGEHAPQE